MKIVVADVLVVWMIRKICDAVLKKTTDLLFGNKEKRALRKAVSIAIDKFKGEHPVAFGGLFKNKLFWDALAEEFASLLDPNVQPNIEELADKVESISPVQKRELQECLNRLFEILREEIVKQPDLRAIEQIRLLFALENTLYTPTIDELDAKARIASRKDIEGIQAFLNVPNQTIELGSYLSSDKERLVSNDDIVEFLENGYNIVLEAEPGAGKSTTLYQIAQSMLDKEEEVFPIFLSLSSWLNNTSFLEFIARENDAFSEQQLTADDIRALARHGHLVFIIDGWNELSGERHNEAKRNIDNLQKDYPSSGMLIATRSVSLPPKLKMSEQITLNRLDRNKRNEIIRNALGNPKADELISHISNKAALRQISQTPFYLDKLISVYQDNGSLPETKETLLNICAHANDDKEAIVETLNHRHHNYMIALAVEMFKAGTTELKNYAACQIISSVSQNLINDRQLGSPSDPQSILETLAKYHLLINLSNGKSWKFQHQQFQEWYASCGIEDLIISAAEGNADILKELRSEVLNIPLWEEALFFAIERLARQEDKQNALTFVTMNALEIDPLLAAEMIAELNEAVWEQIKETILDYVNKWHEPGKIDRAISFMIASGRPEFAEKIWPLITQENQQERLPALRAYKPFRFGCLGGGWRTKLKGYPDDTRDDILSQIADYGGIAGMDVATEAALEDPSSKVKISILEVADFRHSEKHIQSILEAAPPDVWEAYCERLIPSRVKDENVREHAIDATRKELEAANTNMDRARLCLRLLYLGVAGVEDQLFEALSNLEDEKDDRWRAYHLIEEIHRIDAERTARVLIERFVNGGALCNDYDKFIDKAERKDRKRLALHIAEGRGDFSGQATAAKVFQKDEALVLLKELLRLREEERSLRPNSPKELRDRTSDLERALKNIPESHLVGAMVAINYSNEANIFTKVINLCKKILKPSSTTLKPSHIGELAGLLALPGNRQGDNPHSHRLELPDELSTSFRKILKIWSDVLRNNDNGFGYRHELSEISMVLGQIGDEEDVNLVSELLQYDLDYRDNLLQEWERSGRRGQRPNGISMSYTNLYRRAFEAMPHRKVVEAVTIHLNNPEFCKEAAYIIRHAWFVENGLLSRDTNWSPNPDFSKVPENIRKLENQGRPDPHPYVENVLNRIEELLPEQEDTKIRGMIFDLSSAIADTEYGNRVNLLETVIGVEGLGKYACLMKLIQRGENISAAIIKPCCEAIRKEWEEQYLRQSNEWYRVEQWLELLVLSDDPMQVMDLVKDLPDHMQQERTFDRILNGLRYSSSEDAEKTLLALAKEFPDMEKNGGWLKAMHDQLTEESHNLFYQILWDTNKAQHYANPTRWSRDPFVNIIEKIIRANSELRRDFIEKLEAPLAHQLGGIIGLIVQRFDDDDEITQGSLMLLRNGGVMPYGVEGYVTRREPIDENDNMFSIVPSSAVEIRKKLLDMSVNDPERNEAASRVLAAIDELRDKRGRPENEPRHPNLESGIPWPLVVSNE